MKRLTVLTLEFPPFLGGIAVYLKNVCRELGGSVRVIAPPVAAAQQRYFDDTAQPYRITRKKLLFPRFMVLRWLLAIWVLNKELKKNPTDVLMTSHVLPLGYVLLYVSKRKKIPFWINLHGMDVLTAQQSVWKTKWLKKILSRADRVVVNTQFTKREVLKLECVKEDRISIVYPCPDTQATPTSHEVELLRQQLALSGKEVIYSLGRLVERKGFERTVHAMTEVVKKFPLAVYVIGGEGPRMNALQELVVRHKLQNNVRFIGPVHDDKKRAALYCLADVFVMPTITSEYDVESFGIVYLEAAQYGVPSIASDTGGAREAIVQGSTGIIISQPTPQLIAEALVRLLENDAYRKQLGAQAQTRVAAEFIWSNQVDKLRALLS